MTSKDGRESFAQALRHFEAGRDVEAEAACRDVLAGDPADANAFNLLAVILCRRGAFAAAISLLQEVLKRNPANLQALRTLGDAFDATDQSAAAVEAFTRAWAAGNRSPDLAVKLASSLVKLGSSLLAAGKPEQAEQAIRKAVALCPQNPDLQAALGSTVIEAGRFADAAAILRRAIAQHPRSAPLHAALGLALMKLGEVEAAIAAYDQAAALAPDRANDWRAEASHRLALVLRGKRQYAAAAAALERTLALRPGWPDAHSDLGLVLQDAGRAGDAVACYRRAIELDPRHAVAHANLGGALREINRHEEAVAVLHRAIELAPGAAEGYGNLGIVLYNLGRTEEAGALFDQALACDPSHAITRYNRSLLLLLNGELPAGFAEYEWRRRGGHRAFSAQPFAAPEWDGGDLAGRTILVHAEQGFGDTLQFCRYVPLIEALGARVILQVQQPLAALLAAALPTVRVIAAAEPLPAFDCHVPLMSLAWRFGTTLDAIPAAAPYLAADPARVKAWRERLAPAPGLKIGLAWAGNPDNEHDHLRSLPAHRLLAHLPAEGVSLFSLQKELRPGDAAALAAFGGQVADLAPLLHDFSDTAAAVSALDLVITIDSAVAHLAGALARPTWVLLPHALDWRWLRERSDSPWYPTLRLFRQDAPRQWDGALARLGEALRAAVRQPPLA